MWTPKRLLILTVSFAAFLVAYLAYAAFLGGIDGLIPLPEAYRPVAQVGEPSPPVIPTLNSADRKLQQAFGDSSPELQRTIKLELRNRSIVIAVDDVKQDDATGGVKMTVFSAAIFGKSVGEGGVPEINTITSKNAWLIFDRPIKQISDLMEGRHKLVSATLKGDVQIGNNRRTIRRDDDIHMHTEGPMYYQDELHRIWTSEDVELTDYQSKPEPTRVTARGMDVYLTTDTAAGGRKRGEGVTGVERIELRSNVRMDLFVDARSGFLNAGKPPAKPTTAGAEPDKSKVIITTAGTFAYDLTRDFACFEIPHGHSNYPENVEVKRLHDAGDGQGVKLDQLLSDRLELQFRRKGERTARPNAEDDHGVSLEIDTAHATGRQVTLASESENVNAFGNDLTYDARKRHTVLKGPDMIAMKDGNEIHARELWLDTADQRGLQEATAVGPGTIRTLDTENGQRNLQAAWNDTLVFKKEGSYDCLVLSGQASFEDREHHERMSAERIKVLLEPSEKTPAGPAPAPAAKPHAAGTQTASQKLRPHHLEARGNVLADSAEMHITEPTDHLLIWFKDAPPAELPPAPGADTAGAAPPAAASDRASTAMGVAAAPVSASTEAAPPAKRSGGASVGPAEKGKPPITLCARSVVAHVLRRGSKNDLDQLACEGAVHVHQDPSSADDRGMEIRGETLQLTRHVDGGVLVVNGRPGQVQFDKLAILGPEVNIDQRSNKAWVNGIGAMRMLTDTNLDGVKLAQPTELTIHWKDAMNFYGKSAEFRGAVQAEQQASRLLCDNMQVSFDRPISLKEGDKGKPRARIDKLLCDKRVQVEEINRLNGKLHDYKRLVTPVLDLDNEDGVATASGPGELRILQESDGDDPLNKPAGADAAAKNQPKPAERETKLTHVRFAERMQGNNKRRTAVFYGNVEVVNVPSEDPNLRIDLDRPPPGLIYLRCERLHVFSRVLPNGGKSQEMEAHRKVYVQAQEFSGFADIVKYDEAEDRIIFEASEGGTVTLYRVRVPGTPPDKLVGKKIYYWRKTNDFKIEEGQGINVKN